MGDGKVKISVATGVTPQPTSQGATEGGLTQYSASPGTFAAPPVGVSKPDTES
jgi:hypothetical protein